MLKSIKVLGLVAILGTASIVIPMQEGAAQPKKKSEKIEGVVQIKEGKNGKFYFTVRDGDGKLLAMCSPAGFKSADDATAMIETLKQTLEVAKIETVK